MKVLIACEFSGIVREAFIAKGHDAWSCDLLPTEIPGQHIQGDVLSILNDGWDMMIAHPPCTYLCVPGAHYLHTRPERWSLLEEAKQFFNSLLDAPIKCIAVENPVPHKYAELPQYTQIIHPWMFGHQANKRTCLWLKNLPVLMATDIRMFKGEKYERKSDRQKAKYGKWSNSKWYAKGSAKDRSRTFQGIANAMADQWG